MRLRVFILMVIPCLLAAAHPLHISVTDVEYVRNDSELQITVRMFADDLENRLKKDLKNNSLDILHPPEGITSEEIFADFLHKHLRFTVNGQPVSTDYLGFEMDAGSVVSYLLIKEVDSFKSMEVFNDIFLDEFDDQVNLLHVILDGDTHTLKFVRGQEKNSFPK